MHFIYLIIISLIFLLGLITFNNFNTSVNDVAIDKNQEANYRRYATYKLVHDYE